MMRIISTYHVARQTVRRYHCHIISILTMTLIFLLSWIYFFNYRYFKAFLRHPVCITPSFSSKQQIDYADNRNRIPAIENIENVTVFYRNEADYEDSKLTRCPLVEGRRILISYASDCCETSQIINCQSGLDVGGFDMCALFGPHSIDEQFRKRFIDPLLKIGSKRGSGFWVWKPYIILKTLMEMNSNDVLFYADAGSEFVANVDIGLICLQAQLKRDIVLFHLTHPEKEWTKADAFILLGCQSKSCTDTPQILASFIMLRKSFFSIQFVSTWLAYATDPRAVSDLPSTLVNGESSSFVDHRHDQSLLSLLAKKWGLANETFADPSQYGDESRAADPHKHHYINQRYISHTRIKV